MPKKLDDTGSPRCRSVIDFRPHNEKPATDKSPILKITYISDQVGAYYVPDCISGFWSVEVEPHDTYKTASTTPMGHFEFARMRFRLKNAPPEYQRWMQITLGDLIGKGVFVYIDDFVMYVKNLKDNEHLFNEVMNRLRRANLKLNPNKCELLKREVIYRGHVLSGAEILPDKKKVEAVRHFSRPKGVRNVR